MKILLLIIVSLSIAFTPQDKKEKAKICIIKWDNEETDDGMRSFYKEIEDSLNTGWELVGKYTKTVHNYTGFDEIGNYGASRRHIQAEQLMIKKKINKKRQ